MTATLSSVSSVFSSTSIKDFSQLSAKPAILLASSMLDIACSLAMSAAMNTHTHIYIYMYMYIKSYMVSLLRLLQFSGNRYLHYYCH